MNMLHMKYAAEVAKCGSINRAAEKLLIGQPNLSRAIKDLESSLNIKIFDRSSKGMSLTPEGELFMKYAKNILKQADAVEEIFKKGVKPKQRFSASVPRASYISEAFARFSVLLDNSGAEIYYKETNALGTINNVLRKNYHIGIVRYAEEYDKNYKEMFEEKKLNYELIAEFQPVLVMSKDSSLAKKDKLFRADLIDFTEVAHPDPYVPLLPEEEVKKTELPEEIYRRIYVFERGSQFELLTLNTDTFMWVSPISESLLNRYGLVQRECMGNDRSYKDVLIYKNGYTLSKQDNMFIEELIRTKREIIKQ